MLEAPIAVRYLEFSPDGTRLVTCSCDALLSKCSAQVWEVATGKPIGSPLSHGDGVLFAAFSPGGRRVVTASEDFTAIVWDASTGRQLTPPLLHKGQVQAAVFSPDGNWVATASSDMTARVWNARTGDPLTPPLPHLAVLAGVVFLPDGQRLATFDWSGNTWIWPLPAQKRPVEEATRLARLFAGGAETLSGRPNSTHSKSLEILWRGLRSQNPSDFDVSQKQIVAWHEFQAEECEQARQWFAAAFHLKRLARLRPDDISIAERLARATKKLKSGD
jgi:WD40 repeat protein